MKAFLASIVLFLTATPLFAASSRVLVVGPDQLPLPGATVQLFHDGKAGAVEVTSAEGLVSFDAHPGATVVAELDGFATSEPQPLRTDAQTTIVLHLASVAEEMTVSAARSRVPLAEVSSSVTVIDGENLDQALRTSANLADALGKSVPGLAPGTGSASIWGQTLRGRGMQILVDGVPLTTLRNTARDLVSIDPSIVERVEVLRGTTSLYGDGATGGLINIITRRPEPGELRHSTEVSFTASAVNADESAGAKIVQSMTGGGKRFDWRVDLGAERTGSSFDADGDLIPPDPYGQGGLADTDSYSLAAKAGWQLSKSSRLNMSLTAYDSEQNTDWTSDPSVNPLPARSVKSRAISGLDLEHPQGSENRLLQLGYENRALLGGNVRAQAYAREYQTVFTPFDGRSLAIYGNKIFQSRLESESFGARTDVETPLPWRGVTLYWGVDAGSEKTEQPVWIVDPAQFDASGGRVIRSIEDRPWVPLIDKRNQAAFAQLEWMLSERWLVRGGVRHDRVQAEIPTFSTLAGATIDGGARDWSDTLVNGSVVHYFHRDSRLWASYSQGFSLPDIGLVLRSAPAGASLDTLPFEPQIVEGFELGWAASRKALSWSVASFYSTSELGTSTAGFNQPVVRAPERVYGAEAQLEFRRERWASGASASWSEGKHDPNRDGVFTYLNNFRIAAPNGTIWLEHQTTPSWRNRVQALFSGDRDRFETSTAFGERPIESYSVVDLASTFALRAGELTVGVQNLLNERYFVRDAQLLRSGRNDSHALAPGTTVRLTWAFRY